MELIDAIQKISHKHETLREREKTAMDAQLIFGFVNIFILVINSILKL